MFFDLTMIKKGTQCSQCDRREGDIVKVILQKHEKKFFCPWCLQRNNTELYIAIKERDLYSNLNKKLRKTINLSKTMLSQYKEVMEVQNQVITLFMDGKQIEAMTLYRDFLNKDKNDIN